MNFKSGREPWKLRARELQKLPESHKKGAREPHKSACENVQKSAHERKNVPVKTFEKVKFTGTFKAHGKKLVFGRRKT